MNINQRSWLALAGLLSVLTLSAYPLKSIANSSQSCRSLISGTYLTTMSNLDGSFASRAVLAFGLDGNLSRTDSNQGGVSGSFNAFTTSLGSWQCDDRRTVHATAINFSLPGVFNAEGGIARADYHATVNAKTGIIKGTIEVRFFNLTDDPYKTDLPAPAISGAFEGNRVPSR